MAKRNKKNKVIPQRKDEYDLKSSLGKLNQRKDFPSSETSTDFKVNKSQTNNINQTSLKENLNTETSSIYFQLNESFNSRYDTLNDNIKTVSDKISNSSDTLRQELEGKIEPKLDTKFFLWTIGALVIITTLIFTLSYSNLVSETKDNSNSVKSLEKDIENQKNEIKDNEKDIEKIEKKQNEIEIKIIKSRK
jgi:hypothetical protein